MTRSRSPALAAGARRRAGAAGWPLAAGLVAGSAVDAIVGDPRRWHPVAGFGRGAQALQDRVYRDSFASGAGYAACCVVAAVAPGVVAHHLTRDRPALRFAAVAAAAWTVTGAASLAAEASRIQRALEAAELGAARQALPRLCGRDPRGLDEKEIARAVVESVAENTSDALVAPLVWGAAAGLPGLLAYRAINTLDAMVGYRSERYARFGCAAARLDDAVNWAPARLTGLLAVVLAPVAGGRRAGAWRTMRGYGRSHPSPNAGWCEAAFAGALGVRLGGTNAYDGAIERRPCMGDGRPPEPADIARAVRLCRAITAAAAIGSAAAALLTEPRPRTPASRAPLPGGQP